MSYTLKKVTIRTNNTKDGINRIGELWQDVNTGRLPIIFDNKNNLQDGVFPVSMYSNYESNENGDYDLSILGVDSSFFVELEKQVKIGKYKKYESIDDNIIASTKKAWEIVWKEQKENIINRAYKIDYESSIPAKYTNDNKAHCCLWISIN
ncbi:MAG: AraC family transcriptional regulator [Oscillospiraceae bacterium]|nr:AraC family transcriptional regulator [Oscillospiraceae bacterium]